MAYIASAVRTPIGGFNGSLARVPAPGLGAAVAEEALKRAGLDKEAVDEVIAGCVLSAGLGPNPARQASIAAGLDKSVRAFTVNKACASGLKAVVLAFQAVSAREAETVVAIGMENMSRSPYLLPKARFGYRLGDGTIVDSMIRDGFWDVYNDYHMGRAAEITAEEYKIGRKAQDRYAERSFARAIEAQKKGLFESELVPMTIPVGRDRFASLNSDEGPQKFDSSKLKTLPPLFSESGTITAGNSASMADGAAAVVVVSEKMVKHLGIDILARITAWESSGTEPGLFGTAPASAIEELLKKTGLKKEAIDLFEINELYSATVIAVKEALGIDDDRLNVNGGAVSMGNPIGAGGARMLTTLVHAMKIRGAKRGIAATPSAGGEALAVLVERV